MNSVLRLSEGRNLAVHIALVSLPDLRLDGRKICLFPLLEKFLVPSVRTDLYTGGQIDFDRCVREYDCSYVPAVHDDILLPSQLLLQLHKFCAHIGIHAGARSHIADLRRPDQVIDVLSE